MLVSAIMPTGRVPARRALSGVAIECFFQQTYDDRQLVIVNHSDDPFAIRDKRVKEVMVNRPDTMGELRNLALDAADGDLILTWDDDDWYDPRRMEIQVDALRRTGKAVVLTCYTTCDLHSGEAFVRGCCYYVGGGCSSTVLFPRGSMRYRPLEHHEDGNLTKDLHAAGMLAPVDNWDRPLLYVRACHGANICSRDFMLRAARRESRELTPAERQRLCPIVDVYVRHGAIRENPLRWASQQIPHSSHG